MRLTSTSYTVAEIRDQFNRKELKVDKSYQRSPKVWPLPAKSYFIDTILNGYIVPPVYFSEVLDDDTKRLARYIVDGQQRLSTIREFIQDEFKLSKTSKDYSGRRFSDLDDEDQNKFLSYSIKAERIHSSSRTEILEMFRRINSFTVPLNSAEKRHSQYQGTFKWFINELTTEFSPMLIEFGILTQKQIIRMADAELFTEISSIIINGITNKNNASLNGLYMQFDDEFLLEPEVYGKIFDTFHYIRDNFSELANTFMMKQYSFHSLCSGMFYNKYSLPDGEKIFTEAPQAVFTRDDKRALASLQQLSEAHELQDDEGEFAKYVKACSSSTHTAKTRAERSRWILKALQTGV